MLNADRAFSKYVKQILVLEPRGLRYNAFRALSS
jgi:hypothetical protein